MFVFLTAEWSMLASDGPPLTLIDTPHRRKLEYILDPKELQSFAVKIARGMAHLERRQITHRYQKVHKSVVWKQNNKLFIQINI